MDRIASSLSSTPPLIGGPRALTVWRSRPRRYVVQAGTVIPAALITGIRSDLPGQIMAQVTETAI